METDFSCLPSFESNLAERSGAGRVDCDLYFQIMFPIPVRAEGYSGGVASWR